MKSFEDAHDACKLGERILFEEMLLHPARKTELGKTRNIHKIGSLFLPTKSAAIEIEHLQFARGRTFENKIIFIDELQNYTPFEAKQLIERIGIGCKIFAVGDPEQIDNASLTPKFNGLVWLADKFYGRHPRVSFMHLNENYRSQTAEIARQFKAPGTLG